MLKNLLTINIISLLVLHLITAHAFWRDQHVCFGEQSTIHICSSDNKDCCHSLSHKCPAQDARTDSEQQLLGYHNCHDVDFASLCDDGSLLIKGNRSMRQNPRVIHGVSTSASNSTSPLSYRFANARHWFSHPPLSTSLFSFSTVSLQI